MPQCRKGQWWTQDAMLEQALKAFEQSVKEFNGDSERFYLTGLSMGGYGTWSIASKHPGKFAALVPICGGIRPPARVNIPDADKASDPNVDPYAEAARKIGKTPVWIFHGGADPVVPPDESRKMNEALKAAGGDVKYTNATRRSVPPMTNDKCNMENGKSPHSPFPTPHSPYPCNS